MSTPETKKRIAPGMAPAQDSPNDVRPSDVIGRRRLIAITPNESGEVKVHASANIERLRVLAGVAVFMALPFLSVNEVIEALEPDG